MLVAGLLECFGEILLFVGSAITDDLVGELLVYVYISIDLDQVAQDHLLLKFVFTQQLPVRDECCGVDEGL